MTRFAAAALFAGLIVAPAAEAKPPPPRAAVFQQVIDCRPIKDNVQRLTCYDAAAAKMVDAEQTGQVVVVDREQMQAVRKQAFGFTLPSLDLFRGSKEPELDRVSLTINSASQSPRGKWRFEMSDGSSWVQTDGNFLANEPHRGSTAVIRKAALGSFFLKVDGQPAIRAARVQ